MDPNEDYSCTLQYPVYIREQILRLHRSNTSTTKIAQILNEQKASNIQRIYTLLGVQRCIRRFKKRGHGQTPCKRVVTHPCNTTEPMNVPKFTPFQLALLDSMKGLAQKLDTINTNVEYIANYLDTKYKEFQLPCANVSSKIDSKPSANQQSVPQDLPQVLPQVPHNHIHVAVDQLESYDSTLSQPTKKDDIRYEIRDIRYPISAQEMEQNPEFEEAASSTCSSVQSEPHQVQGHTTEPVIKLECTKIPSPIPTPIPNDDSSTYDFEMDDSLPCGELLPEKVIDDIYANSGQSKVTFVRKIMEKLIPRQARVFRTIKGSDNRFWNKKTKSRIIGRLNPRISLYALNLGMRKFPVCPSEDYDKAIRKLSVIVDNTWRKSYCYGTTHKAYNNSDPEIGVKLE